MSISNQSELLLAASKYPENEAIQLMVREIQEAMQNAKSALWYTELLLDTVKRQLNKEAQVSYSYSDFTKKVNKMTGSLEITNRYYCSLAILLQKVGEDVAY